MDDKEKKKEYFAYLVENYPIRERFENILTQIQDIIEALGIMDRVEINMELLGQAILDYFEDIDRLKKYEGIDKVNVDKIYGYETYWLVRRKPIQIIQSEMPIEFLHINEKVFACILIAKMLKEMNKGFDDINPRLITFIDLLYYNLKYRLHTQQSLELMIEGFFCGCCFVKSEEMACV